MTFSIFPSVNDFMAIFEGNRVVNSSILSFNNLARFVGHEIKCTCSID